MTVEYQCERVQRLVERGYQVTASTSYDTSEWPRNIQVTILTLSKHGVYIVVEFRGELAQWINGETVDVVWRELGSDDIQPGAEGEHLRRMVHENIIGAKTSIRQMLHDHGLHTITEPQRMRVTQRGAATLPRVTPHSPRAPVVHQISSLQEQFYRSIDEQQRAQIADEHARLPVDPHQTELRVQAEAREAREAARRVALMVETREMYDAMMRQPIPALTVPEGRTAAGELLSQSELDRRIIARAAHLLPSEIRVDVTLPRAADYVPVSFSVTPAVDTTETFTPRRKVELED